MILGAIGKLFGGGGSAQSPKEMGYKTSSEFEDLINYGNDRYFKGSEARDFSDTLSGAVKQGNLDPNTALAMVQSRVNPTSSYFKSKQFEDLLNYDLSEDRARGIIGDAFATNYFRPGDPKEINAFYQAAEYAGVTNNPNELRNFMTQRLARSPEGEAKRPFDAQQYAMASYYGAPVRDTQGNNTGQYAVFGRGEKGAERVAQARKNIEGVNTFVQKQLAKMGA